MKLCIADPPYLGNADLYGAKLSKDLNVGGNIDRTYVADHHPDAHLWDDPATHQAMVADLVAGYDGWAIAMLPAHLRTYLPWVPADTRVAVWHDPDVMPTGSHPRRRWEAVLVRTPPGRRKTTAVPQPVGDVLTAGHHRGKRGAALRGRFAGHKPPAWTRWVLDMLGYDQDTDTVTDLFHGSGAVAAELAQLTLPVSAG